MMKVKINRERAGRIIEEIRSLELLSDEGEVIGHVSFSQYGHGPDRFYEVDVSQLDRFSSGSKGQRLSICVRIDEDNTGPEVMTTRASWWRFRPNKTRAQRALDKKEVVEKLTGAPVIVKAYYMEPEGSYRRLEASEGPADEEAIKKW